MVIFTLQYFSPFMELAEVERERLPSWSSFGHPLLYEYPRDISPSAENVSGDPLVMMDANCDSLREALLLPSLRQEEQAEPSCSPGAYRILPVPIHSQI